MIHGHAFDLRWHVSVSSFGGRTLHIPGWAGAKYVLMLFIIGLLCSPPRLENLYKNRIRLLDIPGTWANQPTSVLVVVWFAEKTPRNSGLPSYKYIDLHQAFSGRPRHTPWPRRLLAPTAVSRSLGRAWLPDCRLLDSVVSVYLHAQTCTRILPTHTYYSTHTYCTYGSDMPPRPAGSSQPSDCI